MKYLFLILVLMASGVSFAQSFSGKGSAMSGGISVGGIFKKLLIPNAIPVGRIASNYGYEVWDFTNAKSSIKGNNRASFCFSTMELTQDLSIIGLAFGGEVSRIRPVGICPKNLAAVAGEDLTFSVAYDVGSGTKSLPIGISFSYGFDLSTFTKKMLGHFQVNNPNKRKPSQRLWRLHSHILKYLAKKEVRSILNPSQSVLLKLFTSTSLMSTKDGMKSFMFAKDELDFLSRLAKNKVSAFNAELSEALYEMSRDKNFYYCKNYYDCEEIYVDFLIYSDAINNSMSDCHSVSLSAAFTQDFSISLAPNMKFEVGFGYGVTATERTFTSNLATSVLAAKEFSTHRFKKHSLECTQAAEKAGGTFGEFLSLLGYGKN